MKKFIKKQLISFLEERADHCKNNIRIFKQLGHKKWLKDEEEKLRLYSQAIYEVNVTLIGNDDE